MFIKIDFIFTINNNKKYIIYIFHHKINKDNILYILLLYIYIYE